MSVLGQVYELPSDIPVYVRRTFVGSSGAQGAVGPKGDTGPTGDAGVQGVKGATGAQGSVGLQGVTGASGMDTNNDPTMIAGPFVPDLNWVPGDLNISQTLRLGPGAAAVSGTQDNCINVDNLSVAGLVPPPATSFVYYDPLAVNGTNPPQSMNILCSNTGLWRSTSGGFGNTGEAIAIPHGLRQLIQPPASTYTVYVPGAPNGQQYQTFTKNNDTQSYMPIQVTPVLDTNEYQFVLNVTGVDSTNIYANICKINSSTGNVYIGKPYTGYYNVAWTCLIVSTASDITPWTIKY